MMMEVADATKSDVGVIEGEVELELLLGAVLDEGADDEVKGSVLDEVIVDEVEGFVLDENSMDEVEEIEITVTTSALELLLDGASELESERDIWLLVGVGELSTTCELLVVLSVADDTLEDTPSCEVELTGSELDELCTALSELLDDVVGDTLVDDSSVLVELVTSLKTSELVKGLLGDSLEDEVLVLLEISELVAETSGDSLTREDSVLLELVTSLDISELCD